MNKAYLSPTIPVNLLSLGHMQRCGATYGPDPFRPLTHVSIYSSPSGPLLAHATLSTNNLLSVDYPALRRAALISPSEYYNSHALTTYPLPHFNAEQRARADAAEELHHDLCHPSDRSLCVNLSTGKLPFSTLTSADVTLNRQIRGPCPHCAAGKHHNPPHPPSPSPPATSIGAVLSFDPQLLPEISPGQHTHEIILVDEFSGHLSIVGATSKSTPAIFKSLHHLISTTYNSHQHRVQVLHGDCEKINTSLASPLGSIGIILQTSTPGEHAARVERSILTLRQLTIATLSALSYHLPVKYTIYLHKAIAAVRNSLINVRSSPSTPDELLRGHKPSRRIFPFGTCCMVTQHVDKRTTLAKAHQTAPNSEPKAELGVCMGPDCITGRTLFLLANGSIVPRRPTTPFPAHFVPFDWVPKTFVVRTPLPIATESTVLTLASSNTVVQLPDATPVDAIAVVTNSLPSPISTDLLSALHIPPSFNRAAPSPSPPDLDIPQAVPPSTPDTYMHLIPAATTSASYPPLTTPPTESTQTTVPTSAPQPISAPVPEHPPLPTLPPRRSQRTQLPNNFWKGCYSLPLSTTPSQAQNESHGAFITAIQRKIQNAKDAAIRNRTHRLQLDSPTTILQTIRC